MKHIILILSLVLTPIALKAQSATQEINVKTRVTCDHCNVCETCKSHVETSLYKVKGVKLCEMNPSLQTIRVVYNSKKTDEDAIRKAITSCGYDADDMKATEESRKQLDGCCKGGE